MKMGWPSYQQLVGVSIWPFTRHVWTNTMLGCYDVGSQQPSYTSETTIQYVTDQERTCSFQTYPLVNSHNYGLNHHFLWENPTNFLWSFSSSLCFTRGYPKWRIWIFAAITGAPFGTFLGFPASAHVSVISVFSKCSGGGDAKKRSRW